MYMGHVRERGIRVTRERNLSKVNPMHAYVIGKPDVEEPDVDNIHYLIFQCMI